MSLSRKGQISQPKERNWFVLHYLTRIVTYIVTPDGCCVYILFRARLGLRAGELVNSYCSNYDGTDYNQLNI